VDLGLTDRVCLVTGSTAGIGLETARYLAADGARVVVCGRDAGRVATAQGDVRAALGVVCDLAEPQEPGRLVAEVERELGRLDCLVNNIGFAVQVDFAALTDEDWESMWQLNVMSYVRAIRAALPLLRESGGVIVNVSSTAGKRPSSGMPHYSVTKAAVLSLSRLVADLYARDGVRCNAVTPGPTETDAWLGDGGLADQQGDRDEVLAKVGAGRPLGRLARADEIASVIVFLCSERSSYVTGSAWSADGGTVPIII
jgi:3-oxoacyl-[acyl-carrier protein] reductase